MPSSMGLGNASSGQANNDKRPPNIITNPKEGDLVFPQNVPASVDLSRHFSGARPMTYTLTTIPDGMALDADTGILSGTPTTISGAVPALTASNMYGDYPVAAPWTVVSA